VLPPLAEPVEQQFGGRRADRRPLVADADLDHAAAGFAHHHPGGATAMADGIVEQVPQRLAQQVAARRHRQPLLDIDLDRSLRRFIGRQHIRHRLAHQPCRRDRRGEFGGEVGLLGPRQRQQLIHQMLHLPHVAGNRIPFGRAGAPRLLQPEVEHGERRPELMRRIGGEAPLALIGAGQPVESIVGGARQRHDLGRQLADRDAAIGVIPAEVPASAAARRTELSIQPASAAMATIEMMPSTVSAAVEPATRPRMIWHSSSHSPQALRRTTSTLPSLSWRASITSAANGGGARGTMKASGSLPCGCTPSSLPSAL